MPPSVELQIERLAYGGEGVGHVDGKVCFVEEALPGEKIVANIIQEKKSFLRGVIDEIIVASPHRQIPPCLYARVCGGCQYQHLAYPRELYWKEEQLREHASRFLGFDGSMVRPIRHAKDPFHYRNSVTLHETVKNSPQSQVFGFVAKDNRTVVPIDDCLIADEKLKPVFGAKRLLKKGETKVSFRVSETGLIFDGRTEQLLSLMVGDKRVITSSKGFFQSNLEVTAMIGAQLREWIAEKKPDTFVDLFAGCGTFSLFAADENVPLVCVEENPHSIEALQANLKANKLEALVKTGLAEKIAPKIFAKIKAGTKLMVMVDPPRKGMEASLSKFLGKHPSIETLVYLSCHMGTMMRDMKLLQEAGRLRTRELIPYDMFPKTKHLEALAFLSVD